MEVHPAEGRAARDRATTSAAPNGPNGLDGQRRMCSMVTGALSTKAAGADSRAALSMVLAGVTW